MADESKPDVSTHHRVMRYAALLGAILALACRYLPERYQGICEALAAICQSH